MLILFELFDAVFVFIWSGNGVPIPLFSALHPCGRARLSGAVVQALWRSVLETVWWLLCDEAQQVGCPVGRLSAGV